MLKLFLPPFWKGTYSKGKVFALPFSEGAFVYRKADRKLQISCLPYEKWQKINKVYNNENNNIDCPYNMSYLTDYHQKIKFLFLCPPAIQRMVERANSVIMSVRLHPCQFQEGASMSLDAFIVFIYLFFFMVQKQLRHALWLSYQWFMKIKFTVVYLY